MGVGALQREKYLYRQVRGLPYGQKESKCLRALRGIYYCPYVCVATYAKETACTLNFNSRCISSHLECVPNNQTSKARNKNSEGKQRDFRKEADAHLRRAGQIGFNNTQPIRQTKRKQHKRRATKERLLSLRPSNQSPFVAP